MCDDLRDVVQVEGHKAGFLLSTYWPLTRGQSWWELNPLCASSFSQQMVLEQRRSSQGEVRACVCLATCPSYLHTFPKCIKHDGFSVPGVSLSYLKARLFQ